MDTFDFEKLQWKIELPEDHTVYPGLWRTKVNILPYTISILAGEFAYSTPRHTLYSPSRYEKFEVAILEPGTDSFSEKQSYATHKFVENANDTVLAYYTREEITDLIEKIQKHAGHGFIVYQPKINLEKS
tara:strand:+ start:2052 stop:2441 length:390 start_codon:yes stop_codon:yes gene_type:complete